MKIAKELFKDGEITDIEYRTIYSTGSKLNLIHVEDAINKAIEFAKQHVEAARIAYIDQNAQTLLNMTGAYPLDNIK